MDRKEFQFLSTLTHRVSRYEAYCTSLAAHGSVAPHRDERTLHFVQLRFLG
jgi:hypothetical protein